MYQVFSSLTFSISSSLYFSFSTLSLPVFIFFFFFFNDTATTEIYTLSLHDALPIFARFRNDTLRIFEKHGMENVGYWLPADAPASSNTLIYILAHDSRDAATRSEEHTSELQSQSNLVCRLLLEKKKK